MCHRMVTHHPTTCNPEVTRRTTGVGAASPASTAIALAAASSAIAVRVSSVAEPRCGISTTFSSPSRSGWTSGSRSNTSSAAPAIDAVAQRGRERRLVDDRPARGVDEVGVVAHARERVGVDQVARLGRERAVQRDDVRALEQLGELDPAGLVAGAAASCRRSPCRTRGRAPRSRGRSRRSRRSRASCRAARGRA